MSFGQTRQMYDVDVNCSKCGTHISQLPFQPTGDRPVYCSDCNRQYRQTRPANNMSRPPRQMYDVDLKCAQCGMQISQLPFMPSNDKPVYCKDCMMARRNAA